MYSILPLSAFCWRWSHGKSYKTCLFSIVDPQHITKTNIHTCIFSIRVNDILKKQNIFTFYINFISSLGTPLHVCHVALTITLLSPQQSTTCINFGNWLQCSRHTNPTAQHFRAKLNWTIPRHDDNNNNIKRHRKLTETDKHWEKN